MFRKVRRFEDALRQFTKVQHKLPNDKTIYYERGVVYQEMENHELAIEDFKAALEIDGKYAEALFCIGKSRLKSGMVDQAIKDFNRALSVLKEQERPEIFECLGLCYQMKQEFEEAQTHFDEAIAKDPRNVQFHRSLSRCCAE